MVTPLYVGLIEGHPLLSPKFSGIEDEDYKTALQVVAERLLGLVAPAYATQPALDAIGDALALQVNFLVERGIESATVRSISNTTPGQTTQYRDRWVDPVAYEAVRRATGTMTAGFTIAGRGV